MTIINNGAPAMSKQPLIPMDALNTGWWEMYYYEKKN